MAEQMTPAQSMGKQGAAFKDALVKAMVQVHGDMPSNAEPLSHQEELRLWMLPTSPAAIEAFKRGATMAEAEQANRMWADAMRAQQQNLRQQGQADEQIHEAGFSDERIFQATRKHAYERGKAASKNDPALEVEFHSRMAERAARLRAGTPEVQIQDVTPAREEVL